MIILHAGTQKNNLYLWAEVGGEKPAQSVKNTGRKNSDSLPNRFPYDGGAEVLSAALKKAGIKIVATKRLIEPLTIWLPTEGRTAFPSSLLIAEPQKSKAKLELFPWTVNGLSLKMDDIIELLCVCVGRRTLAPGVIVGNDLAFWAASMRFAGAIVAKQQYLPGMIKKNEAYAACWEPVFDGQDKEHLTQLAKNMPAVARAFSLRDADKPPESSPISLLSEFIAAMLNSLVRTASSVKSPILESKTKRKVNKASFNSIHDQWLFALQSPLDVMEGEEAEFLKLSKQIRTWQRPVTISTASQFRFCLRLEEPETGKFDTDNKDNSVYSNESWYVRYLIQAVDDLSLIIPVKKAWNTKATEASILNNSGFNTKEYILSSLGRASGVCPRIEKSLKTSEPGGYELDASGAHEFLREKAIALKQAGFVVMLPSWWTNEGTKLRLSVRANVKSPKMQGKSGLSLDQILKFEWDVAIGDSRMSLDELEALAKLKTPLVRIRGQWLELSANKINNAIEMWNKREQREITVRDVIKMALGAGDTMGQIAFKGVVASGWMGELLKRLEDSNSLEEISVPHKFNGKLRPYQQRGYSWLTFLKQWGLGACLADDMGLGKTIQALALIQKEWKKGGKPSLIICPTSVLSNWHKEAARFTPELPVMIHHGIGRNKGTAFKKEFRKFAIVISSYALLHRDIDDFQGMKWAGLILDEAQNVKNPETKQAKAARSIESDYRIALTGTPVENNVGDLWSIMEFLNPGFLGNQNTFKRNFFIPIQANRDPEVAGRLKRITGPFILRRMKTDKSIIADLPEKMEMKVFSSLTKEQASLYTAVLKETEDELFNAEGIQRKGLILATLSKLKQVCNHPAHFMGDNSSISGRSGKLTRLTEMIEEIIEVGDHALIFTQFAEMGAILKRHFQETFGIETPFLFGGVTKKNRDAMVERFQAGNSATPIFILSLKAGGTGLNLTAANRVFHYDRWWNPAVENQATDRAFRIGQTKNVQVHKFICAGTLEEKIDEMIERKKEIANDVIGTGEGWITELSNKELKEIFKLREDAIRE